MPSRGGVPARAVLLRRPGARARLHVHRDPRRHHAGRLGVPARPRRGRPLPHGGGVLGLQPRPSRGEPAGGERGLARRTWSATTRRRVRRWSPSLCDAPAQPGSILAHGHGLRRGRGQHPRHRLLGRRLRLLRAAPGARRLRRDRDRCGPGLGQGQQGRHGRPVLPRPRQLFVASSQPPSLAAITPLSVYRRHRPGRAGPRRHLQRGLRPLLGRRGLNKAEPYGQGWEQDLVDGGDTTCEENQDAAGPERRRQRPRPGSTPYYDAGGSPTGQPHASSAQDIEVPVFLTGVVPGRADRRAVRPLLWDKFTERPRGALQRRGTGPTPTASPR